MKSLRKEGSGGPLHGLGKSFDEQSTRSEVPSDQKKEILTASRRGWWFNDQLQEVRKTGTPPLSGCDEKQGERTTREELDLRREKSQRKGGREKGKPPFHGKKSSTL